MINAIIEAIGIALDGEFGDGYEIHMEGLEQDLKEPCFFVFCLNPTNQLFFGKRYFRENQFCIQYFPANKDRANEECHTVAERLYSCLEYIMVTEDLVRGTKMKYEVVDGILSFFVNYDLFVYKMAASDAMEEISENVTVKG